MLVYAVTVTILALLVSVASSYVLGDIPGAGSPLSMLASVVAFGGIALGIPLAIGIALLKYRLYNIDTLISRTLVYGALTALLAVGYLGTIMALQGISSLQLQPPSAPSPARSSRLSWSWSSRRSRWPPCSVR